MLPQPVEISPVQISTSSRKLPASGNPFLSDLIHIHFRSDFLHSGSDNIWAGWPLTSFDLMKHSVQRIYSQFEQLQSSCNRRGNLNFPRQTLTRKSWRPHKTQPVFWFMFLIRVFVFWRQKAWKFRWKMCFYFSRKQKKISSPACLVETKFLMLRDVIFLFYIQLH